MKGLSFQKEPRHTGLYAIGNPNPDTNVKFGGKRVGTIRGPSAFGQDDWSVSFMVETREDHYEWRWARIKKRFATEPEARAFVKNNIEKIMAKHKLFAK